jgi:hypothetical protein
MMAQIKHHSKEKLLLYAKKLIQPSVAPAGDKLRQLQKKLSQ